MTENSDTLNSSIDFVSMMRALTQPGAFPFALPDSASISLIQTHASAVLLVGSSVYKLKKPKDFGFFDYSTPALRRHFCIQEVYLNARLAPQVYLGVAPVLLFSDGQIRFGATFPPDDVPLSGTPFNGGYVIDYAVVMVHLPDEATLEYRVRAGSIDPALLVEIARCVADFHESTQADEEVTSFGGLGIIQGNWDENFKQMKPYIGDTLDATIYDHIVTYTQHFLQERTALFSSRVRDKRIRDCHGDLRLQHVYILDDQKTGPHQLAIIDGIEFNTRFRYGDVAGEVAFLMMELDAANRSDLSRTFVDAYVRETGDEALYELLPFYACYRACVRGKVLSFQLDEPEVPAAQQKLVRQQAKTLFALAASYASGPTKPTMSLLGGLMGTGKSTLAAALHRELGWVLVSSDRIRKQLAHVDPAQPQVDAFGQGLYDPLWTSHTYDALLMEARKALSNGRSVLLDASFIRRADRQTAVREAAIYGANVVFIECACPREVALQRLVQRWAGRLEGHQTTPDAISQASDGRPDLYNTQSAAWEAFDENEEPGMKHILLTTTLPITLCVEQVLDVLGVPRSFVGSG